MAYPEQREDFAQLARLDAIRFLFYDESLRRVLAPAMPNDKQIERARIRRLDARLLRRVNPDRFDFERAGAGAPHVTRR